MNKIYIKLIILSAVFAPLSALALEVTYPTINGTNLSDASGLSGLVKYFFNFAVAFGAVLALIFIIYSGIMITNSQGDPSKIEKAKDKIKNSLIGLTVLLTIYILLTTINPNLILIKDLSIQSIIENNPISSVINPVTKPSPTALTFEEIPVGSITENILAKNISCFDKDRNLIDCKTKDQISKKPKDEYSYQNSILYCYEYDSQGNKTGILENKDRLYCLDKMTEGLNAKIGVLRSYIDQLYGEMNSCSCSACQMGGYEPGSSCPDGCKSYCHCCGSPRDTFFSCNGPFNKSNPYTVSSDPCGNRASIDAVRESIKQLINGGSPDDPYYDWRKDPEESHKEHNTKYMTLTLYLKKIAEFKNQLDTDVAYLNLAEKTMRISQAEQISLAELQALQENDTTKSVGVVKDFPDFDITSYCKDFNCTTYNSDGTCNKIDINSEGRACMIKDGQERYLLDGDPATFYFNSSYKTIDKNKTIESTQDIEDSKTTSNSCSININEEKGMYIGLIPIGETVDGSKKFANEIIVALDKIVTSVNDLIVPILTSDGAIYYLPESCQCSNCRNGMIELKTKWCGGIAPFDFYRCTVAMCTPCEDISTETRICPYSTYLTREAEVDQKKKIVKQASQRLHDLVYGENLEETDVSRVKLLDDLSISRDKLESCVSGYGQPQISNKRKVNLISCQDGVVYTLLGQLKIGPSFPYPNIPVYINCYPFNSTDLSAVQRTMCAMNPTQGGKDDTNCQNLMYNMNMMDNYYCCTEAVK